MSTLLSKQSFVLALILLVALLLRVYNIQQPFMDEFSWRQCSTAMMAENFYKTDWNIFFPQVNWTGPGPSYQGREFQTVTYISALLYTIFGQQDWIGRAVSVVFGVWGVYALHQLVALVWDRRHALAAAALMAIIPFAVFMDRSFLPGPAMTSLVITCMWMTAAYLLNGRTRHLVLALLTGWLGFLTKITGMLMLLPMAYFALAVLYQREQLNIRRLLPLVLLSLVLIVPVVPYYLWARHLSLTYPPYHFAGSGNWIWDLGLGYMLQNKFYLTPLVKEFIPMLWGLPAFLLAGFGFVVSFKHIYAGIREKKKALLHPAWVFHAYLAGLLFFYFIGAKELYWNPWNFHIFTPCVAVFAAKGLVFIADWGSSKFWSKAVKAAAVLLLVGINGLFVLQDLYHSETNSINYRMGKALSQLKQPDDLVLTVTHDNIGSPVAIYHSQAKGWVFPPVEDNMPPGFLPDAENCIRLLDKLEEQGANWIAIAADSFQHINDSLPAFAAYLHAHHQLAEETNEFVIFKLQRLQQ